jgi:hypothetical protein
MKCITRERVKVDRVACPWLVKHFVDEDAEFVFMRPDKVMEETKRLDAIPYDVKTGRKAWRSPAGHAQQEDSPRKRSLRCRDF